MIGSTVLARIASSLVLLLAANIALPAYAHDPSAWGGLFRSRDFGASWFPADAGLFIGGNVRDGISLPDCVKSGQKLADRVAGTF